MPSGKKRLTVQILFLAFCLALLLPGCTKNKYSCESNRVRSFSKIKKNKSNYGALYSPKMRPVPKNYRINNGR